MNMEVEEKPIDFNALETELQAAIDADVKYWRENDVKIRAVEQRVASYEEFKDLVKAAHLKPLDKARKQNEQEDKKNRIWNSIASKRSESGKEYSELYLSNTKQGFLKSTPKTTAEFLKQWQHLEGNDRFHFLKKMGAKNVKELFKYELPVGLLGQILHAFLLVLPSEAPDIAFMIKLMDSLTGTKRFKLNLQFLSPMEISTCEKIMENFNNSFLKWQSYLEECDITEQTIIDLHNKYTIKSDIV